MGEGRKKGTRLETVAERHRDSKVSVLKKGGVKGNHGVSRVEAVSPSFVRRRGHPEETEFSEVELARTSKHRAERKSGGRHSRRSVSSSSSSTVYDDDVSSGVSYERRPRPFGSKYNTIRQATRRQGHPPARSVSTTSDSDDYLKPKELRRHRQHGLSKQKMQSSSLRPEISRRHETAKIDLCGDSETSSSDLDTYGAARRRHRVSVVSSRRVKESVKAKKRVDVSPNVKTRQRCYPSREEVDDDERGRHSSRRRPMLHEQCKAREVEIESIDQSSMSSGSLILTEEEYEPVRRRHRVHQYDREVVTSKTKSRPSAVVKHMVRRRQVSSDVSDEGSSTGYPDRHGTSKRVDTPISPRETTAHSYRSKDKKAVKGRKASGQKRPGRHTRRHSVSISSSCSIVERLDASSSDDGSERSRIDAATLLRSAEHAVTAKASPQQQRFNPIITFSVNYRGVRGVNYKVYVCGPVPELGGSASPEIVLGNGVPLELDPDGREWKDYWQSAPIEIKSLSPGQKLYYRYYVLRFKNDEAVLFQSEKLAGRLDMTRGTRCLVVPRPNVHPEMSNDQKLKQCRFTQVDASFGDLSRPGRLKLSHLDEYSDDEGSVGF